MAHPHGLTLTSPNNKGLLSLPPASVYNLGDISMTSTQRPAATLPRSRNWFDVVIGTNSISNKEPVPPSFGPVQSINANQNPILSKELEIPSLKLKDGPPLSSTPTSVITKTSTNTFMLSSVDATTSATNNNPARLLDADTARESPADIQNKTPAGSETPPNIANINVARTEKPSENGEKSTPTKPSIANVFSLPKKGQTPSVTGDNLVQALNNAQNQVPHLNKPMDNSSFVGSKVTISRSGKITLLKKPPVQDTVSTQNQSRPPPNVITRQQLKAMRPCPSTQGSPATTISVKPTPQGYFNLPEVSIIQGNGNGRTSTMGSLQSSPVSLGKAKIQPIIIKRVGTTSVINPEQVTVRKVATASLEGVPANLKRADPPMPVATNQTVPTNILKMFPSGSAVSITRVERPKISDTVSVVSRHR